MKFEKTAFVIAAAALAGIAYHQYSSRGGEKVVPLSQLQTEVTPVKPECGWFRLCNLPGWKHEN